MTETHPTPIACPNASTLPFSALEGHDLLKKALMILAVDPRVDGLLVRGEKGTGKSTAARALARLLPEITVNLDCPYGCPADRPDTWCMDCRSASARKTAQRVPPFETLPLGVTEDQLLGSFDVEHAIREGMMKFKPGILARVNQGVLYVDEVNLLPDHIVDLLLDSAASGVNVVARESVAVIHPAAFILVGTMNPEEGELRPQLQDRFGLCVPVRTLDDPDARVRIMERVLSFEKDPEAFRQKWAQAENKTSRLISDARRIRSKVEVSRELMHNVAQFSVSLEVHGHRADILMIKAACALAALDLRTEITADDLEIAAALAYPHRLRRKPFEDAALSGDQLRQRAKDFFSGSGSAPAQKKSPPPKQV